MTTRILILAFGLAAFTVPRAGAQESGERVQDSARFPVLRKAFRQIRSDVRYHARTLHETASDIRHDVTSTIRGSVLPASPPANDYRHASVYPPYAQDDPEAYYGDREGRPAASGRADDERRNQRRPVAKRNLPSPQPPTEADRQPAASRPQVAPDQEPKIVAPREVRRPPAPTPTAPADPPRHNTDPPSTAEQKESTAGPVQGKLAYPEAKRSARPGFHYSPYEPYELLDTQDIEPGGLARDPGSGKIFRLPK